MISKGIILAKIAYLSKVWKRIVMKIRIKYHLNDINNDFETNLMEVAH